MARIGYSLRNSFRIKVMNTAKRSMSLFLLPILSALIISPAAFAGLSRNGEDVSQSDDLSLVTAQFEVLRAQDRLTISDERHLPILRTSGKRSEYSAVIIHGLYASPYHMKYIQEQLFAMGINSVSILLPGFYQKDYQVLDDVKWPAWQQSAEDGMRWAQKIGRKVIVMGFSTGGLLATMLASEPKNNVAGMLLMAPAFKVNAASFLAAQLGDMAGLVGNDVAFGKPNGKNISYYSPKAALELEAMADDFRGQFPHYSHLRMPILQMGFNQDFTVDGDELVKLAKEAPGIVHFERINLASRAPTWIFSTYNMPVEFQMTNSFLNHGIFPGMSWQTAWHDTVTNTTVGVPQAISDWFNKVKMYSNR